LLQGTVASSRIAPMTGEDLQKLVAQVSSLTPALLEKVRAAYPATGTKPVYS
jgi:hypothetical protein